MADFNPDDLLDKPPPVAASMKIRPRLSREEAEKLVTKYNPDIKPAAVQGEVDNIVRESGGDSTNKTGDSGTSGGLYQHHLSRLTGLKNFATEHKADWTDPDIQVRYARLEKERDYPSLLKLQQTNDDRTANEDAFKRIFERPASVLWGNDATGRPVLGNDRYRFSDSALKEHPEDSLHYMRPQDYLDLSPTLSGNPFSNAAGRSLMRSFNRGDEIESVPTLETSVNGPTATVTEQDGRHRALLAQQEGIEAIPVAIKQTGEGTPSEIQGMSGNVLPHNFPGVAQVQQRQAQQPVPEAPKEPISLLGEIGNAIIPSAQAAEPEVPAWARQAPAEQSDVPAWAKEATREAEPSLLGKIGGAVEDAAVNAILPGTALVPGLGQQILNPGNAAAAARGLAPYAAGAGVGAAMGAPFAGVGAVPGAIAGAGAVGLDQIATGMAGVPGPQQATDRLLDLIGVRKAATPEQRIIENMAGGAANAFTGAGAIGQIGNALKNPISKAVANYLAQRPAAQAASGALSGAASQSAAEAGLGPIWQQLAGLAAGVAPFGNRLAPNWRQINPSPEARQAIEAGFVIPPAEATEGHAGAINPSNALAAEAGKIKMGQLASARNQPVVNLKIQQDLGLPPGTDLTPEAYGAVRAREGKVYDEVVQAVPEVNLARDPEFQTDVAALGKRSESTERTFPSTTEPPDIKSLRSEMLAHARAGTKDVMNYIADLRMRATNNLKAVGDAMAHRKGYAEREAANALEDAMERSVQDAPQYYREKLSDAQKFRADVYRERAQQGLPLHGDVVNGADAAVQNWSDKLANANAKNQDNQTLLDRFRQARKIMAKSYDAQSVTNVSTGDVSATGLGRLLQKGKPFTGNMKVVADAANSFRRAFQNPSAFGGVEPLSVLDTAYAAAQGATALSTGSIGHALAALAPLLRPGTRSGLLSRGYQNAMIAPHSPPQVPLSAITTPLLPTQPAQGNALADMYRGGGQ